MTHGDQLSPALESSIVLFQDLGKRAGSEQGSKGPASLDCFLVSVKLSMASTLSDLESGAPPCYYFKCL